MENGATLADAAAAPVETPRQFSEEKIEISGLPSVLVSNTPFGEPLDLLVVIMHGYGANQFDLVPIGKELIQTLSNSAKSKRIAFAFPGAPNTMPGYPSGRAWWRTRVHSVFRRVFSDINLYYCV